jgi:hypothetical protein
LGSAEESFTRNGEEEVGGENLRDAKPQESNGYHTV